MAPRCYVGEYLDSLHSTMFNFSTNCNLSRSTSTNMLYVIKDSEFSAAEMQSHESCHDGYIKYNFHSWPHRYKSNDRYSGSDKKILASKCLYSESNLYSVSKFSLPGQKNLPNQNYEVDQESACDVDNEKHFSAPYACNSNFKLKDDANKNAKQPLNYDTQISSGSTIGAFGNKVSCKDDALFHCINRSGTDTATTTLSQDDLLQDNSLDNLVKSWNVRLNVNRMKCSYSDTGNVAGSTNTLSDLDNVSIVSDSYITLSKPSIVHQSDNKIIISSQLIQLDRPADLPPKPLHEQMRHRKEYEKMIKLFREKDRMKDIQRKKQISEQLKKEENLSNAATIWHRDILPNWEHMKTAKKTHDLWWNGLPPCVRGKVWKLSIGNELGITSEQYKKCVYKSKEILKIGSKDSIHLSLGQESSVELIRLDISRTFPHLCIFQQGGPYYEVLHCILGAYVCFCPDVGYVQGMSFIAAVLLLNMDELDAFVCFANLLNWPCLKAFFTLNIPEMRCYYAAYNDLLQVNIPHLWEHFYVSSLTPDLYLVDWVYSMFSKSMHLDLACHIWDIFLRDGDEFIFQAALGILHATKDVLLKMDFLHAAQYLTKLPDDLQGKYLFKSISEIHMVKARHTFRDIVSFHRNAENTS